MPHNQKSFRLIAVSRGYVSRGDCCFESSKTICQELDIATLKKFMRFCTGSDLLLQDHIDVSFVNVTGIARRPVAHTCSCLLEIPKTYESFPGFRTEFLAVLNANVWIMDII